MKPDFYTKMVLTVIAVALLIIAFKPSETVTAQIGGKTVDDVPSVYSRDKTIDIVPLGRSGESFLLMNKKTGQIYQYRRGDKESVEYVGRIETLGQRLQ